MLKSINPVVIPQPNVWGSSITQGIRIGQSAAQEGVTPNPNEDGLTNSPIINQPRLQLDQWGPGVYTGGIFTYRIMPTPIKKSPGPTPAAAQQDNIVPVFLLDESDFGTYRELISYDLTPRATQQFVGNPEMPGGPNRIAFDFPRCVSIYCDENQAAVFTMKVYGWDLYGQNMVEQIPFGGTNLISTGNKAFAGVYCVYIVGKLYGDFTSGLYCAVGTSNVFGLPFCLSQACHMLAYSQGDGGLQTLSSDIWPGWSEGSGGYPINAGSVLVDGVDPTDPQIVYSTFQTAVPSLVVGADAVSSQVSSLDVRGIFQPSDDYLWGSYYDDAPVDNPYDFANVNTDEGNAEPWSGSSFPWLTFTYYIAGADMYQNIIAAQITDITTRGGDPSLFDNMWSTYQSNLPERNNVGMKGVKQYWEEPPRV